jgi:hypothetical protein
MGVQSGRCPASQIGYNPCRPDHSFQFVQMSQIGSLEPFGLP